MASAGVLAGQPEELPTCSFCDSPVNQALKGAEKLVPNQ